MFFEGILIMKLFIFLFVVNILPAIGITFYLFKNKSKLETLDKIIISFIISPLLLIAVSFLENFLNIPQNKTVIIFNVLTLSISSFYILQKNKQWKYFKLQKFFSEIKNPYRLIIYFIFIALIFFRIYPATKIFTPITADPIAHSEWLQALNTTFHTTTDFWYPQGLEYFLNYYAIFVAPIYPKLILIFTNLFTALFSISFFYFIFLTTKSSFKNNKKILFPLLVFAVASLVPYPKNLYYTFGKNSFIFAISIIPILFAIFNNMKYTKINLFLFSILSFSLFLIHYPTGIYFYIFLLPFFIGKLFFLKNKKISFKKETLTPSIIFIITTIFLSSILFANIFSIYKQHPPSEDKGVAKAAQSVQNPFSFVLNGFWNEQFETYKYKPCLTAKFVYKKNICKKKLNIDKDTRISLFYFFIISILFFILKTIINPKNKNLIIPGQIIVGFLLLFLFIPLSFKISPVVGTFFFLELSLFFSFVFVLITSWFFKEIITIFNNKKIYSLFIIIILFIFLIINLQSYSTYNKRSKKTSVTIADIIAFNFIKNNLPKNKKILIKLYNVDNKIIAGSDSGVWIPSYTNHSIEVDWLNFSSDKSFEIYSLFKKLTKKPNDVQSLSKLYCKYNIGYIFSGSRKKRKSTTIRIDESDYYKNIYNKNKVQIDKLININCK